MNKPVKKSPNSKFKMPSKSTLLIGVAVAIAAIIFIGFQFHLFTKRPETAAQKAHLKAIAVKKQDTVYKNAYQKALTEKNYSQAAKALEKITKNNPAAVNEFDLGALYYSKLTTVANHQSIAFGWYLKAAKQGLGTAESNVARMYFYGIGTTKNLQQSVYWAKRALKAGFPEVTAAIGTCYLMGNGQCAPPKPKQAEKALTAAADYGDTQAAALLASLYFSGKDNFPQDSTKAAFWAKRAAAKNNAQAEFILSALYQTGTFQITKNPKASLSLLTQSAKAGYGPAQATLAVVYQYGLHAEVKKDSQKASYWKQKALANHAGEIYNLLLEQVDPKAKLATVPATTTTTDSSNDNSQQSSTTN
jgi:TPR repeat protein